MAEEIQLLYFDRCAELCDFMSADWMWIKAATSGENRSEQKCARRWVHDDSVGRYAVNEHICRLEFVQIAFPD
jgi:hypothetical protein